jgi:hypothetical protein
MLSDHFDIVHFAHMNDVLGKPAHAAFGGMRVERICPGDVPDYLCARQVTEPLLAEAKGRFSSINFNSAAFQSWRAQFSRVRIVDSANIPRSAKGYVVATQFVTDASAAKNRATSYIEDPNTEGERLTGKQSTCLGRGVRAVHYARIFNKLDLIPLCGYARCSGLNPSKGEKAEYASWRYFDLPSRNRVTSGSQFESGDWWLARTNSDDRSA